MAMCSCRAEALLLFSILQILTHWGCTAMPDDAKTLLRLKRVWNADEVLGDWWGSRFCLWTGVTCNECNNNSVITLDIHEKDIAAPIPPVIGNLQNLLYLNLSLNLFYGGFPEGILNIRTLRVLDLSNNMLSGSLPDQIYRLPNLRILRLSGNSFFGKMPPSLTSLLNLEELYLDGNSFPGEIPEFLGNMSNLQYLALARNSNLRSRIPKQFGNLSKLKYLWLSRCNLEGKIPRELGKLANLQGLMVDNNNLQGSIPEELTKLSNLLHLNLHDNSLTGSIPLGIGSLSNLQGLNLSRNSLSGSIPESIANLTTLISLRLYGNKLDGEFPRNLAKLANLVVFDASSNQFSGALPDNLCMGNKLEAFRATANQFNGGLPGFFENCSSLTNIWLDKNHLSGEVSQGVWRLPNLRVLKLSHNSFYGTIPDGISPKISLLEIGYNHFGGSIPASIGQLSGLKKFHASHNNLSGTIPPEICSLNSLTVLHLGHNNLSGELPTSTITWQNLVVLDLSNNLISGEIPRAITNLDVINSLDLSNNRLTGTIPSDLNVLKLSHLNLSGNELSGAVPSFFSNLAFQQSFLKNPGMCGEGSLQLESCQQRLKPSKYTVKILFTSFLVLGLIVIAALGFLWKPLICWKLVCFYRMDIVESDILNGITEKNLLGSGCSGKVYKITLRDGRFVAVKKIQSNDNVKGLDGGQFLAEIESSARIRHSNILKLLCYMYSSDSALLVYEFMPNGCLYDRLHDAQGKILPWETRYQIALGAAKGLSYLHHGCYPPVIHRDVKSTNILLDSQFKAHVGDFGLASSIKLLISGVAGSIGYNAPEYAYTLKWNEKSDIYSFGVVLLELVTGRNPIEDAFGLGSNIVSWVTNKIKQDIHAILDPGIQECHRDRMIGMLRVALLCTSSVPVKRPSMKEVVELLLLCSADEGVRDAVATTLSSQLLRNPSAFSF